MTTWDEIRDEVAGMLADGESLENIIPKLEQMKNEMAKANLLKAMNDMKKREQTNEEWFCSLSTEEKAKVFANAAYSTALAPMEILALGKEFEQKKWEMWLKQPHQTKE